MVGRVKVGGGGEESGDGGRRVEMGEGEWRVREEEIYVDGRGVWVVGGGGEGEREEIGGGRVCSLSKLFWQTLRICSICKLSNIFTRQYIDSGPPALLDQVSTLRLWTLARHYSLVEELRTQQHCRDNVFMFFKAHIFFILLLLHYVYIRCGNSNKTPGP